MAVDVIRRSEWGAAPPRRKYIPRPPNRRCVIHHTAGTYVAAEPGKPGPKWWRMVTKGVASLRVRRTITAWENQHAATIGREAAAMRSIQRMHQAFGWVDIGYHYVIFPSGRIYEGRPDSVYGAHTRGANDELGFAFAGNYETTRPTMAALNGYQRWRDHAGITTVRGHYRVPGNATACPGKYLKTTLGL